MSLISYWLGNYIIDILSVIPAAVLVIVIVILFDTAAFSSAKALRVLIVCIGAFTWNVMPFTYLISFLFKQPSSAQRWVAMMYIILGLLLFIMYEFVVVANKKLWYFLFAIFPPYSLSQALFAIALKPSGKGYYDSEVCGRPLTYMLIFGASWFVILLILEYIAHSPTIVRQLGLIPNAGKRSSDNIDRDVVLERRRIEAMLQSRNDPNSQQDAVVIAGLRKVYQQGGICGGGVKNVAVRELYFGIPQGQVCNVICVLFLFGCFLSFFCV